MSKSILISIRPEHVAKILNGDKTIEIRKTAPKLTDPIDVYIYCTKPKGSRWKAVHLIGRNLNSPDPCFSFLGDGKVVAKFTLRKVEKILVAPFGELAEWEEEILAKSCLSLTELDRYLKEDYGYALHIDDLQIFEKPMELSDFKYVKKYHGCAKCPHKGNSFPPDDFSVCAKGCEELLPVRRAPESWQYVEVKE